MTYYITMHLCIIYKHICYTATRYYIFYYIITTVLYIHHDIMYRSGRVLSIYGRRVRVNSIRCNIKYIYVYRTCIYIICASLASERPGRGVPRHPHSIRVCPDDEGALLYIVGNNIILYFRQSRNR